MQEGGTTLVGGANPTNPIIPAQVRIGVTGHRQLPDEQAIRKAVTESLDRLDALLKKNMPKGTPWQYVVVSPLAEGADRIVADIVLNRRRPDEAGEPLLEAPLPVPVVEYKKSFSGGPSSEKEFENFLLSAGKIELLPPTEREDRYLQVGQYVVRNCDVLIAVWNGEPAVGRGGTQEIVEYARKKSRAIIWIKPDLPTEEINLNNKTFMPFRHLDNYNGENPPGLADEIKSRSRRTASKAKGYSAIQETLKAICELLIPHWAKASLLAGEYQKKHYLTGVAIYGFSALAVAAVAIQSLVFPDSLWIVWFEFWFMVIILGIILSSYFFRWHRKWTDYRFIVERLRALTYMRLADLECGPIEAPVLQGDWVVRAFDYIWRCMRDKLPCSHYTGPTCPSGALWKIKDAVDDDLRDVLIRAWVVDQQGWYGKNSKKHARRNNRLGLWVVFLFGITILAAFLHALGVGRTLSQYVHYADSALAGIAILFPVFGAAINGIRAHRRFHRNSERYGVMEQYLSDLFDQICLVGDKSDFDDLINTAYDAMFQENIDWRFTFFTRRHEVP